MVRRYPLALHVFRRDLRLEDNSALINALKLSAIVLPCFIFDKRQVDDNVYKGEASLQFMAGSLVGLDKALRSKGSKLYFFYGTAEKVVHRLLQTLPIKAVFINRDYTPFSLQRDQAIKKACEQHDVDFYCHADTLLHEPEQVAKTDGRPYARFTPFFHQAAQLPVGLVHKNASSRYYQRAVPFEDKTKLKKILQHSMPLLLLRGGRPEGLRLLKNVPNLVDYATKRNFPGLVGTTRLSAHVKFGVLSVRELYHAIVRLFGKGHPLVTELYWRDFFTHVGFHFPEVFRQPFYRAYANVAWSKNAKHFKAWCQGTTGFPFVDAGMRELNATGYMHNRARMVVASFLSKDLHINWQQGEKYFAQHLADYDPCLNNGNWQWAASTGCDAQPYFRLFNPWRQQKQFDPDCVYIKRWVAELAHVDVKSIHDLAEHRPPSAKNYPPPLVVHAHECTKAIAMYKKAMGTSFKNSIDIK